LIKRLLAQGHAISNVIKLDTQELSRLVPVEQQPRPNYDAPETQRARAVVDEMLDALAEMDVPRASRSLTQAANSFSPHDLVLQVLAPALEQLGNRWQDGTLCIASEHAATAMLRTQLGALLTAQAVSGDAPVLCSTPAGELHELGALLVAVVMAMHGRRVLYLGADLPTSELIQAARLSRAWAVALSVVSLAPAAAGREIEELCRALPKRVQVLVGGRRVPDLADLPERVQALSSLLALEQWLLTAPP
jgi:methanogenic corrinoid protein MtbC1